MAWGLSGHPNRNFHYSLGCDCAGGTGNDYSAIVGSCLETNEQVFEYRDQWVNPVEFAEVIAYYGMFYNEGLVVVESNSHGLSTLATLKGTELRKGLYPRTKIYKQPQPSRLPLTRQEIPVLSYGFKTTVTTKPLLIGVAQSFLKEGYKIHSSVLYDELISFSEVITEAGNKRIEGLGDNDDTGIAFMLSLLGILKLMKKHFSTLLEDPLVPLQTREVNTNAWRTKEGCYIIKFEDIFKQKQKKEVWHNA